jgi:hypothetical protein
MVIIGIYLINKSPVKKKLKRAPQL